MPGREIDSVRWYDQHTQRYIAVTQVVDLGHLYRRFLRYIPARGRILDAGCGSGRDSIAFESMGYHVTAMDGSIEMVRHVTSLMGRPALQLRHQDVAFSEAFDGVWSMASLLHVAAGELPDVLEHYRKALVPGGVLFASFKHGDGEGAREGRLFTNQNPKTFAKLIDSIPGLTMIESSIDHDTRPGREADQWFSAICRRG